MMKYIHLHLFRKSLSVQEIKEACRCWNNNIVTLFKQELEADIRHYIAGMRLDAAAYVMRRKKVTISLLAASVGYTEEPFWRDFKAKYDSTPLQFTRANCEELRSEQTVKMLSQDKKARQGIRGKQTVPHYLWRSSNETVRPLRRVRIVKHHWLQRQSSR
jgi:AraC-like DNA-binding protein